MSLRSTLALALLGWVAAALPARAELAVGDTFPTLDAFHLDGVAPETTGRVTLVDFWASWCSPCKDSFPAYAQLHRELAPKGLLIVGVSVDDNAARYAAFVKSLAPPFTVVRDERHDLVERVRVEAMPTCFLLDRSGRVRYVHHGFHGAESARAFQQEIETLLAEPAPHP
ncbi:MAG TPA: TlpA disulfide reductase family protein [Lacunisphaera sp.]|jgi:thiol-disulfide isomerase/thioredoxin|nr:TlpA disulfide reductase family protein [Lacunisphaera sp.]